jgi:hypothetical protein
LDENYCPDVRGRRPDVRLHPRLPRGRGFTCGRVFTVRRCAGVDPRGPALVWTWRGRADMRGHASGGHESAQTRGRIRIDARSRVAEFLGFRI